MELWIRSQDKETLIVANHLDIYTVCFDGEVKTWNIEESGVNLGEYRTKERALEVLDEIQRILMPNIMSYSPIVESKEDFKNHCMKIELCGYTTEYDVIALSTYVYEMPKE